MKKAVILGLLSSLILTQTLIPDTGFSLLASEENAKCPENCLTCKPSTFCSTCAKGYYQQIVDKDVTAVCVACPQDKCKACTSATFCTECSFPFRADNKENKCILRVTLMIYAAVWATIAVILGVLSFLEHLKKKKETTNKVEEKGEGESKPINK